MEARSDVGVVLMNLGSPDSTAVPDVQRYLNEFLMDKRVIDKPYLIRWLLVTKLIVPRRAPKSAEAYRSIWWEDGSPLIVLTKQLEKAIQHDLQMPVEIAMRYGNPSPAEAYDKLLRQNPQLKEVILFPLYPHYAMSSYETAVEYAKEIYYKKGYGFKLSVIPPFYNAPDYIDAVAESMRPYLQQDFDHVLFSYHGIPARHVRKTDITGKHCLQVNDCCHVKSPAHDFCYRHQVINTSELVAAKLQLPADKWSVSFQSRLGRDEWLLPYTVTRLEELPKEGKKKLLIVCPAFVSDCLETLEEIGVEGKDLFINSGGDNFTLIPCLNIHPLWVEAVVKWCTDMAAKQ
ncbi:ferrochelatase [Chitinophaga agrisoli]|uniref:Ferrochelatase n=1 Tax=Chitinophaga agrisoli TaxID=2607653 RepID=A0A5B2VKG6_9BACT|nr:ferrochelatase [Chitinophaga agrisoli]KAA2240093.1 ferrochelatase [Chitinophaga agrisoli]